MPESGNYDAYTPVEMARRVETVGVAKASLPLLPLATLAVLAGAFIAFGALFYTVTVTGSAFGYGPTRLLGGLAFSLGLILVVVGGAELFTGNALIVMAWADGKATSTQLLRNWCVAYAGNFVGAIATAVAVWLSGVLTAAGGEVAGTAIAIAEAKAALPFAEAFMRGVLCNVLVCLAVWLTFAARRVAGKVLAIVFPITAFVALGFEHSIANMYLIPIGMLAGADVGVGAFAANLLPVTLGNMVGGGIFVGLVYYVVYVRPARQLRYSRRLIERTSRQPGGLTMSETDAYDVSAENLKKLADKLVQLLRIRTLPIGMKLFEDADEMLQIPGVRTPTASFKFTTCQLVTQSRMAGFTLGVVHDNVRPNSNCGGIIGLNVPGEDYLSGAQMDGVWFADKATSKQHQDEMVRVTPGRYNGLCASPLRSARLDPPDIVLFYGTPAQTILFVNGLQWKRYRRYDMTITGESACSDSWGRALQTRETSISIPCYAERRYGGVADDEMLLAMPPDEFARGIEGLEALSKNGLRYPIPPYGSQMDPALGMARSYPSGKSAAEQSATAATGSARTR